MNKDPPRILIHRGYATLASLAGLMLAVAILPFLWTPVSVGTLTPTTPRTAGIVGKGNHTSPGVSSLGNVSAVSRSSAVSSGRGGSRENSGTIDSRNGSSHAKGQKLLALLYPPGLLGGYRNQVIRFTGLCLYAQRNNLTQLYQPSLLWSTQVWVTQTHNSTDTDLAGDAKDEKDAGNDRGKANRNVNNLSDGGTDHFTTRSLQGYPIPMDWIFDIAHWNRVAQHEANMEGRPILPTIVPHSHNLLRAPPFDCWQDVPSDDANNTGIAVSDQSPLIQASFRQGRLVGVTNVTERILRHDPTFNIRRHDVYPLVRHCQRPVVYGGGKASGRLWNDMMKLRENADTQQRQQRQPPLQSSLSTQLDHAVLRALRPADRWRAVADACLADNNEAYKEASSPLPPPPYAAVHARLELEMWSHACGKTMERNLTLILDQVDQAVAQTYPVTPMNDTSSPPTKLLLAVSRQGMQYLPGQHPASWRTLAEYNLQVLDDRSHGMGSSTSKRTAGTAHSNFNATTTELLLDRQTPHRLQVLECGERLLEQYYRDHPDVPDHGTLLQSVVNFHLAVQSSVFVGATGSSYSTDVWTTRFHLGRGATNYRYTQRGQVELIENGGLPNPHVNCGTLNKKLAQQQQQQQQEGQRMGRRNGPRQRGGHG